MEKQNKVSIIIPVFNCEKYIKQCIESVLKQTYENIEIIAIDDDSTDRSYDILKKYKNIVALKNDKNQRCICHKKQRNRFS